MGRGVDLMDVRAKLEGQDADVRIGRSENVFVQFFGAFEKLQVAGGGRLGVSFGVFEHAGGEIRNEGGGFDFFRSAMYYSGIWQ